MRASFSRLDDDSWGIKVSDGVRAKVRPGQEVEVQKRDGEIRHVTLGEKVAVWNGRDIIFRIAGKKAGKGNGAKSEPKPKAKKARKRTIKVPENLTVGEMSELLSAVHAQVAPRTDESFALQMAFNAVSLASTALYEFMRENEDWS